MPPPTVPAISLAEVDPPTVPAISLAEVELRDNKQTKKPSLLSFRPPPKVNAHVSSE